MKLHVMHVVLLLIPCLSSNTQLALPENTEPNANETVLSALMTKQLLEDSKSIVTKCVNCVGKCINCVASKIKGLVWKNTEKPIEKNFMAAIEAHAARKEIINRKSAFAITETTMNEKTYLIIALQNDSQLWNLKIEKNKDLGIFLYKEMNDDFMKKNSLQKSMVKELYKHWKGMTEGRRSTAQLLITGHSIGGGFAQILGAYFKSQTETLLQNLELKECDKPTFTKMMKKTKVYTFSTPFVFLEKQTEGLPSDWNAMQRGSYNFISTTNTFKVTSKTLLRKIWDRFVPLIFPSIVLYPFWTDLYGKILRIWPWYTTDEIKIFTRQYLHGLILKGPYLKLWNITRLVRNKFFGWGSFGFKATTIVTEGLIYAFVFAIGYSLVNEFWHLLPPVKSLFSKSHPDPIFYDSVEANPKFLLLDENFTVGENPKLKQFLTVDDHIKYFFSNADFMQRKTLLAIDQKEETTEETFVKDEPEVVAEKEVENPVLVNEGMKTKTTNDQVKLFPIAKPDSFVELGVITVFILSVFNM